MARGVITLNDVGDMLSAKGNIGGAIGCISAMISKDARDKDETTSNDVKKLQEFICGGGGTLKEMIDHLNDNIVVQNTSLQDLIDKLKDKKILGTTLTDIINKATDAIEKKLDDIISSISKLESTIGGSSFMGSPRDMDKYVDKFKQTLEDAEKANRNRLTKLFALIGSVKALSFKDLLKMPKKIALIKGINDKLNSFADEIDEDKMNKTSRLIKDMPNMMADLIKVSKISKMLKDKDFDRIYKILGLGSGTPPRNSVLGLVDAFSKLDEDDLNKAKKNAELVQGVVGEVCGSVVLLVLFSPAILLGGVLAPALDWALFTGLGKKGGIVGLLEKLAEKKDEIKEANKAIAYMALGFATLGLGIGTLYLLTKNIEYEPMVRIIASIAVLSTETWVIGQFKDDIKKGAEAMVFMGAGLGVIGLGLGILFKLTNNIEWEQIAMVGTTILGLSLISFGISKLDKKKDVVKGSLVMAVMGACLIPLGLSLMILMKSVRGANWEEFGMLAATIGTLSLAVFGVGALMSTGFGAVAWGLGLVAIGTLGLALIPLGIGLNSIKKVSKGINKNDIKNLGDSTANLIKTLASAANGKERRNARRNARLIGTIGRNLLNFSKMLKSFNEVAPDSIQKMKTSVSSVAEFFFSDKKGNLGFYSLNWKKRRNAKKNSDTIGRISDSLYKLSISLKTFNDVSDDSINKTIDAVTKISDFFFVKLESYSLNRRKRRNAKKDAGTIEIISDSVYKLAMGLKAFNEIGEDAAQKAENSISKIAEFFFGKNGIDKYTIRYKKKKKQSKTLNVIADTLERLGNALQVFNNQEGETDKAIESIDKIAKMFFSKDADIAFTSKAWGLMKSFEYLGDGLESFGKSTKNVDINKINGYVNASKTMRDNILANWKSEYKDNADNINYSFKQIVSSFNDGGRKFRKNVNATNSLFKTMNNANFSKSSKSVRSITSMVNRVNNLDVSKTAKLTEMFKSFASIGKGGVFNRFDKRVKEFTNACKELVFALNGNTDALNRDDEEVTVMNESGEQETMKRSDAELMPKQTLIMNVRELAMAIADELNSLSIDCDANVNLSINGENGNEFRISRQ